MSDVEYSSGYSKSSSISPSRIRSRSTSDHKSRSRSSSHSKTRSSSLSRPPSPNGIKYKIGSRHSYSRSRSYSGNRQPSYRSHSQGSRSRHSRHENPKPNKCLGIFGLSVYTTEPKLYDVFIKYGSIEKILIIMDAKTGRSRGFGFAYFKKHEDAKVAREECSGLEIDGRKIRVDFSITQCPHKPTPGIYMGRPTMREERSFRTGYNRYDNSRYDRGDQYDRGERYDRYDRDRDHDDHYDGGYRGGGGGGGGGHYREHRLPSHYKNRSRYDRSRSRSYSTCRYQ